MFYDQVRFNEFLNSIPEINPKTLALRLKELEKDGLIVRKVNNTTPVRVEYRLTGKGWALKSVIAAMADFSMTQCAKTVFADGKPHTLNSVNDSHPIMVFSNRRQ